MHHIIQFQLGRSEGLTKQCLKSVLHVKESFLRMHHTYRLLPVWSSRSDTWADVMSSCPGWMGPCWSLDSSSRTGSFSGGIAGLYWNSPSLIGNSVDSSYRAWTIQRNFFWRFHIENCLIILLIWDKCLINQDHVSQISVKPSTFTVMWKKKYKMFSNII